MWWNFLQKCPLDLCVIIVCVTHTPTPQSTLKCKHNAISYYRRREAHASGIVHISKEGTLTHLADTFTQLLVGTNLKEGHAGIILYYPEFTMDIKVYLP